MLFPIPAAAIEVGKEHQVRIAPDASFGFPGPKDVLLEAPVSIRRGVYDIDFVGAYTYMGGRETFIRHVSSVGRFCSIASNLISGQVEHPTDFLSASPVLTGFDEFGDLNSFYDENRPMVSKAVAALDLAMSNRIDKISIGNDVWIGEGVFIRRGVTIGDGAVVAARSVVTKAVPPYAIVAGTPAKVIRFRFEPDIIDELLRLRWWNYGLSALKGVDFTDIRQAAAVIGSNIDSGLAEPYSGPLVNIGADGQASVWRFDPATEALVEYQR